ncbi:ribonuclease D [Rickettsiales bacterium]|nr:ribonuclease D [Rickettsiales bacterium]
MTIITDNNQIKQLCRELSDELYISVDTEFLRDKTYYPKLCLIQIGIPEKCVAIDPLAAGVDLSPVFELFNNDNVLKVFHAAKQDLEIILNITGSLPQAVFDTQVAAMVCGYGGSVGYANLVKDIVGIELDKSSRFTDWSRRPLSDKQLSYALSDVSHLCKVYEHLQGRIDQQKRSLWVKEEMAKLLDPKEYEANPDNIWKKAAGKSGSKAFLGAVRALSHWREEKAKSLDKPRGHIIKDQTMLDISASRPANIEELLRIRGVGRVKNSVAQEIVDQIKQSQAITSQEMPKRKDLKKIANMNKPLIDLLRVLLTTQCQKYEVADKLIANSEDLGAIAAYDNPEIAAMKGWRYEVFGKYAIALKKGDIALYIENGKIEFKEISQ